MLSYINHRTTPRVCVQVVATKPDLNALRPHARQPLHPTQLCAALRPPRLTSPDLSSGSTVQSSHGQTVATAPQEANTGTGEPKRLRTDNSGSSRNVTFGENTIKTFEAEDIVQTSVAAAAAAAPDDGANALSSHVASNSANLDNLELQARPPTAPLLKAPPADESSEFLVPASRSPANSLAPAPMPGQSPAPKDSSHAAIGETSAQPGSTLNSVAESASATVASIAATVDANVAAAANASTAAAATAGVAGASSRAPPEDAAAVEACLLAVMREHAEAELNPKQIRTLCEQSLGGGRSLAPCKDWVRQTIYALRDRYFADDDDEDEDNEEGMKLEPPADGSDATKAGGLHEDSSKLVAAAHVDPAAPRVHNHSGSGNDDTSSGFIHTDRVSTARPGHLDTHPPNPASTPAPAVPTPLASAPPVPLPPPPVPLLRDRCFALPDAVTVVALAPDGWCVLCCHRNGSVRLYSLLDPSAFTSTSTAAAAAESDRGSGANNSSHRSSSSGSSNSGNSASSNRGQWGYELGFVDATCLQRMDLHMEVTTTKRKDQKGAKRPFVMTCARAFDEMRRGAFFFSFVFFTSLAPMLRLFALCGRFCVR